MTEEQAERMIKLLEEMNEKLKKIDVNEDGVLTVKSRYGSGVYVKREVQKRTAVSF